MPTLYEIADDLRMLEELLLETGGEITDPERERALDVLFSEYLDKREDKIDAYCSLIREMESRRDARQNEADRLTELAARDDAASRQMKARLLWFMQDTHTMKLETPRFRLSVAANGGQTPLNVTCKPEELPAEFQKITISPDSKALRQALEAGEALPFATLVERGFHLRIK
jgi:Siphovirus Gp157